jgi:Tol biopolymer transport system component
VKAAEYRKIRLVRSSTTRLVTLAVVVIVALAAIPFVRIARVDPPSTPRIAWVGDAHQFGPVGYRDPAGAISPDGQWLAYSEGRFLRVRPIDGGPVVELPANDAQIRTIAWSPDNRSILADGYQTPQGLAVYDRVERTRRALWADRDPLRAAAGEGGSQAATARVSDLRQPAWSPDGRFVAAIVNARDGQELWTIGADGAAATAKRVNARISFPAWTADGTVACVATENGTSRVTIPCGGAPLTTEPPVDVYGPLAFARGRRTVYASAANGGGTVDLWAIGLDDRRASRLTSFSRDTYAPTIARDDSVLFKTQSYRTVVAVAPAAGGPSRAVATFQSETPSWHPSGRFLGITYGTWRRVPDDAKYPDIAQDAGIVALRDGVVADRVTTIVHASPSEDQSLCWSPNGRWIAFHSHQDQSDDIWLRPANGDAAPTRISFLGRGAEVGWPRWSPDGRALIFTGADRAAHRVAAYVVEIDQDRGEPNGPPKMIAIAGAAADVHHAEWLPDNRRIAVLMKEGPGRQMLGLVSRDGGEPQVVHRFASEHDTAGLGVSPDGGHLAFVAPAGDGFFQVFAVPVGGGTPRQVTTDPSNKTQPAWSPDGSQIAFTVWSYDVQFWRTR